MLTRETLAPQEKQNYNRLATHVLQSWEWGEFRQKTGVKVIRPGVFAPSTDSARASTELSRMSSLRAGSEQVKLVKAYQLTIHPIPHTPYTIGYFPRGPQPDKEMLEVLADIGRENNAIFFKLEPAITREKSPNFPNILFDSVKLATSGRVISQYPNLRPSPRPLFTNYTFQIDLTKSEEELMSQMKEKTRYNVRLAEKKGVAVKEDNSPEAFETYLRLTKETTKRQKFYAHDERYHRLMWETLHPAGIAHLLLAQLPTTNYQLSTTLVAWVLFTFNKVLYYPYGASSTEYREMMASNLMMWEAIKFGKKMGCETFDLWGALGPNPDPKDPWYGFHRFKEGYGGKLVEFVGSYDFVLNPLLYPLYNLAEALRWKFLRFKRGFT